jgi:hypothetical protein
LAAVVTSSAVSSAKRSKARTLRTFETNKNTHNEKQPTETQNDNTFKDVFFQKKRAKSHHQKPPATAAATKLEQDTHTAVVC